MFRHCVVAEMPGFSSIQFMLGRLGIRLRNGFLASDGVGFCGRICGHP
jgi:hypothetical protein